MASHFILPNCLKLSTQHEKSKFKIQTKTRFRQSFGTSCNVVDTIAKSRLRTLCVKVESETLVDEDQHSCSSNQDCLINENGWAVRNLMPDDDQEMRQAAYVQAQAFHVPFAVFDDFFFQFFQAEVLAALIYRLKNSPSDRYACLVAEPEPTNTLSNGLVGVVDITVLRDKDVVRHLQGAEEYVYVSGIAVLNDFRRRKVATVLLKACETVAKMWGYEYLVLRAYEDDYGARQLYTNAGYSLVSGDPPWTTTWIGRKRRIVMIKRTELTTL